MTDSVRAAKLAALQARMAGDTTTAGNADDPIRNLAGHKADRKASWAQRLGTDKATKHIDPAREAAKLHNADVNASLRNLRGQSRAIPAMERLADEASVTPTQQLEPANAIGLRAQSRERWRQREAGLLNRPSSAFSDPGPGRPGHRSAAQRAAHAKQEAAAEFTAAEQQIARDLDRKRPLIPRPGVDLGEHLAVTDEAKQLAADLAAHPGGTADRVRRGRAILEQWERWAHPNNDDDAA